MSMSLRLAQITVLKSAICSNPVQTESLSNKVRCGGMNLLGDSLPSMRLRRSWRQEGQLLALHEPS